MDLNQLLQITNERQASDLHIVCGVPPVLRVHGDLVLLEEFGKTMPQTARMLAYGVLNEEQIRKFEQECELDFSFGVPGLGRYRVNVHKQRGSIAIAIRRLESAIRSWEELGLPPIVEKMALLEKGLVLVTGGTGSGKSTTLATMINIINTREKCHIITVEDPIEYLYSHNLSVIEQREVSSDTLSFANALKYVLRQDPDVILVGEMRDLETIAIAITAAETGHLVLGTLHTTDAVQTIDRVIDVFPAYQQQQVRIQVALTLQGVICQQLMLRKDKSGRVAVVEAMVVTSAIRNLIREGKTHQIYSSLETGAKLGMQSVDTALADLASHGIISEEDALLKARDVEGLKRRMEKSRETHGNG